MSKTSETGNHCKSSVKVGILHSLSGTMAIGEASLKDAELMAIAEINAAGGVLGKAIEPVIEDGASLPAQFAQKARKLIEQEQVVTIFGGWSSASRKAVLPVLEEFNAQLWYPVEYEGLESSAHIFYTGICPNQQVEPALSWAIANKGKRIYLIGSNYVFPRTINKIIRAHLKQQGGEIVGEEYILLGEQDFQDIIPRIQATQPDLVFNSLNGDSNIAFYHQYRKAGISATELPILAVSVAEDEVRRIGEAATGHYATWGYFQSVNTPQNQKFVHNFQARYGKNRVTSDPIEAAYTQVYLWKQSVETAGTFDVEQVRKAAYNQTFEAPGGVVRIEANNHICKTCRIGEILPNGQFKIVWETPQAIAPLPWLGIETVSGSVSAVAIEMLGEVSQAIQYSCQMEEKSRQLEMAMAEVKATNERLERTQAELVASETRFRELRSRVELLKRRLSSQINTSLNIDTILKTAVSEIRNLLSIDRCQFLWYNTDCNPPTYEPSQEARDPMQSPDCTDNPLAEIPVLGKALQQLQLLQVDDVIADP
ncbi:MAG TPA: urea ABC transporter substrate-binding protein, partial [Vampirovibrionales bacterium]